MIFFLFLLLFKASLFSVFDPHVGGASFLRGGSISPLRFYFFNPSQILSPPPPYTQIFTRQTMGGESQSHQNVFEAIRQVDIIAVVLYVKKNPLVLESTDKGGFTPLQRAAQMNHLGIVEFLIEQVGPHIFMSNKEGNTALHLTRSLDIAKALVEAGLDINQKNLNKESPLSIAKKNKLHELLQYYLSLPKM